MGCRKVVYSIGYSLILYSDNDAKLSFFVGQNLKKYTV